MGALGGVLFGLVICLITSASVVLTGISTQFWPSWPGQLSHDNDHGMEAGIQLDAEEEDQCRDVEEGRATTMPSNLAIARPVAGELLM